MTWLCFIDDWEEEEEAVRLGVADMVAVDRARIRWRPWLRWVPEPGPVSSAISRTSALSDTTQHNTLHHGIISCIRTYQVRIEREILYDIYGALNKLYI